MELLRIALNAKQIREACADWARIRTTFADDYTLAIEGIEDKATVFVVASKKYKRKAKAQP